MIRKGILLSMGLARSIVAALVAGLVAASTPAIAQTSSSAGAAGGQTQAQAQAELDAAIQKVQGDVTSASAAFTSDATPTLAATASKFASDTLTVSNGLAALQTYTESVMMPVVTITKLAAALKEADETYQRANAINANSQGSNDCEQIARLYDKLNALLDVGSAANASQDEMLDTIKGMVGQVNGNDAQATSRVSSDLLQKLAQSNTAAADINGFLVASAADDAKDSFYKNCGSYAGPVTASMTAHFTTKQGQEWWTYETTLYGVMRLHYFLKDAQSGASAPLTGEFFGSAVHFEYKTDPYNTAYVKLVAGGRVTTTETAPVADDEAATPTYTRAQMSPVGFIADVTGTMTGSTLALQLTDSPKDFDPDYAQGSTVAIVFSPLTNLMPVRNTYKLPYKNARWILDQFFGHGVTLNAEDEGGTHVAHLENSRTRPGNQNSADYSITGFVCDPACT
jgi:hypothetical protein